MARIGNLTIPAFLDPLPAIRPGGYQLLRTRPGMAQRAVLFEIPRYAPVVLRSWDSAPSETQAYTIADAYAALRDARKLVALDDGLRSLAVLVLDVDVSVQPAGSVVGGAADGDSWLIEAAWEVLPE